MTATRKQNIGLYEGWADAEDAWGAGMNDNLRRLDLLVMARVLSLGDNSPPGSPADGDAYVVGGSPTGAWASHTGKVARWNASGGVWEFITPLEGWALYVADESRGYTYNGSAWVLTGVFDAYTYIAGQPGGSATILRVPILRNVVFAGNFAGSLGAAGTAATGSTAFSIKKNGTTVGTATFGAGASTATFTSTGGNPVLFSAGDILSISAPASPDATLADIGFGITGTR